ncbi:hypothetical protein APHAL10511_008249, partial [Amanita phalloides]
MSEIVCEVEDDSEEGIMDEGKAAYEAVAICSVTSDAIEMVAGLAQQVHDSATLQVKLEKLIEAQPKLSGQKWTLTCHVLTCWNSDFACLASHVELETPVKQLTSDSDNDLGMYTLNQEQWNLAKELTEVLEIFSNLTYLFSKVDVPLIHEVIPMLEAMEHDLQNVYDNEVYCIAIVMCPDKKYQWFQRNPDWHPDDHKMVKDKVFECWKEFCIKYDSSVVGSAVTSIDKVTQTQPQKVQKWATSYNDLDLATMTGKLPEDSLEAYLDAPLLAGDIIQQAGGQLAYWEQALKTHPKLAQFALNNLTAP